MTSAVVFDAWQERVMFIGAWRRSQKPRWSVEARVTAVESHISSVGKSVVDMADRRMCVANGWATHEETVAVRGKDLYMQAARVSAIDGRTSRVLQIAEQWGRYGDTCGYDLTVSRDFWWHMGTFRGCLWRVVARELAVEGQVSRFLSREVLEHVCGVGFIRRSRDLHRSKELSHGFAWVCWILTQHRAMVAARCRGVKIQQRSMCDFWWWCVHDILLCLLEMFCLMPRTKFGSDTMLNILLLAMQCIIPYCVC